MANVWDRYVHASHPEGEEVVRYDRQGHWYIEIVEPSRHAPMRQRVNLAVAVKRAKELVEMGGTIHLGEPGGGAFDRKMKE